MDEQKQIKVNVEFTHEQSLNIRRLIREQSDVLRRMIATAVQADEFARAKSISDELLILEASLEAVRAAIADARTLV